MFPAKECHTVDVFVEVEGMYDAVMLPEHGNGFMKSQISECLTVGKIVPPGKLTDNRYYIFNYVA